MALDTSHDCWHGAYSSFKHWRHAVAEAAGYWVAPVKFENGITQDTIILDWGHLPPGHLEGEWDEIPYDPLVILLTHQDFEGRIKAAHCNALADALEAILPKMDDSEGYKTPAERTRQFITGLRAAATAGEDVDFH